MDGTAFLIAVAIGALLGAAASVITRRVGAWQSIVFALAFVIAGLSLITVVGLGPVLTAMMAFSVTGAIFDPRPGSMATS